MTVELEDKGIRELRYADGSLCMVLGARCARCMEVHYGSAARAFHAAGKCDQKPAVFIVVPREEDRAEAVMRAMQSGYTRKDADAIVRVEE